MGKSFSGRDLLNWLAEYGPHQVGLQVFQDGRPLRQGTLQVVNFKRGSVLVGYGEYDSSHESPLHVLPILHSLAGIPKLSRRLRDTGTPVQELLHRMHFVHEEDLGAGEHITEVTVIRASDIELHLAVGTEYVYPCRGDEGYKDDFESGYHAGANYELTLTAYGDVYWRNVTADNYEALNPGKRRRWNPLLGSWVMRAFAYLMELHVAVSHLAEKPGDGSYNTLSPTEGSPRYVRKAVPMQEGGAANGE